MITLYVNTDSKWRQVGRRRRHGIPSEFRGHVCRGLETEAVEPRRDQDHYGRGTRADPSSNVFAPSLKPFEPDDSYLISQRQPCRQAGPTPVITLMFLGPTH